MRSKIVKYKEQELLFYYKCFSTFLHCTASQIVPVSIPIPDTLQQQPDSD